MRAADIVETLADASSPGECVFGITVPLGRFSVAIAWPGPLKSGPSRNVGHGMHTKKVL